MVKFRRLSPDAHLPEIIDAWLFQLGATKPSPRTLAAYRADVEGVARRIDTDGAAVLCLEHLTKPVLRAAFASWAADHAASSVLRAHSAWSSLFDFLVAEDLVRRQPDGRHRKTPPGPLAPKAIKADDAAQRLLTTGGRHRRPGPPPLAGAGPGPGRPVLGVRDPRRRGRGPGHGLDRRTGRRPPPRGDRQREQERA